MGSVIQSYAEFMHPYAPLTEDLDRESPYSHRLNKAPPKKYPDVQTQTKPSVLNSVKH